MITLAGTPLGNPQDASPRLVALLGRVDVIAAEDTRRVRRLLDALGVKTRAAVVSYFEGNERERAIELVERARGGEEILVLTDAGMPTISDPGYRIVRAAIDADVPISCVPGPSAVVTALALSGLPTDRFRFEGFLPRKAGERRTRLAELAVERCTMVFFEAPHRVATMLSDLSEAFGAERQVVVCRELTKTHEEVVRGTLSELSSWAEAGVLGEVTVVVAGADAAAVRQARGLVTTADWVAAVHALVAEGVDQRSAIADVAVQAQVARRDVYDAVIRAKHEP